MELQLHYSSFGQSKVGATWGLVKEQKCLSWFLCLCIMELKENKKKNLFFPFFALLWIAEKYEPSVCAAKRVDADYDLLLGIKKSLLSKSCVTVCQCLGKDGGNSSSSGSGMTGEDWREHCHLESSPYSFLASREVSCSRLHFALLSSGNAVLPRLAPSWADASQQTLLEIRAVKTASVAQSVPTRAIGLIPVRIQFNPAQLRCMIN